MAVKDLLDHSPKRRVLLQRLAAGASASLALHAPGASLGASPDDTARAEGKIQAAPSRRREGDMVYRRLGRTNLWISEISLGGSPLPDERLLFGLLDRGVNYIDMSDSYENGNAERKTGRAVKRFGRDKIHIHTRFHLQGPWTEASIIASVEGSMRRLAVDNVDILGIHGVEKPEHLTDDRILGAFEKLKTRGIYRFRGLTCHVNSHAVIPRAVESGLYDMVQIGYNVFDIQETEKNVQTYSDYLGESGIRKLIDLCRTRDIGVTAMKVLKIGGRRQTLTADQTAGGLFPAMLKWALENDHVASVVTEILNEEQMEQDLGAVGKSLTVAERRRLYEHVAVNTRDYCHFCGSCEVACPAGMPTARMSRSLVYLESYGKPDRAVEEYRGALGEGTSAPVCADCGACERACPYGLPVRARTRRAKALKSGTHHSTPE
jgi:predicted aldo/keto reductase-like oxidoreductase